MQAAKSGGCCLHHAIHGGYLPFQKLQKLDLPIIFFDKVAPQGGLTKVCVADEQEAMLAAGGLISTNRKKILSLFGDIHMSISKRRHDTYVNTFQEHASSQQLIIDFATSGELII